MSENHQEEIETIFYVQELKFEKNEIFLGMGEKLELHPVMRPAESSNRPVCWHSENEDIARVDEAGIVSAVSIGKTKVSATSDYGRTSCTVFVQKGTQLFDVEETLELILDEKKIKLNTNLIRGNGDVSFVSMNPDIADISDTGILYLHKVGTAGIILKAAETEEYYERQQKVDVTVRKRGDLTTVIDSIQNKSTGIKVKWSAVEGATGYYLYREREGGSRKKIAVLGTMDHPFYLDSNVENGKNYTYYIRAFNDQMISNRDCNGRGIMFLNVPVLKPPVAGNGCVKLQWESVYGAMGYYVYRRDAKNSWRGIAIIENEMSTTYIDYTVKNGEKYDYIVRAYSGEILGAFDSLGQSIVYLDPPVIEGVVNLEDSVQIQWQKVCCSDKYYVYRRTRGGKWRCIAEIEDGEEVSYLDTSVQAGIKYIYTVRAGVQNEKSDYDHEGKGIMYLNIPVLKNLEKENGIIKLQWGSVKGAQGYRIYRKTANSQWSRIATLKNPTDLVYCDKEIQNEKQYIYTVRAVNGSYLSFYDKKGISLENI